MMGNKHRKHRISMLMAVILAASVFLAACSGGGNQTPGNTANGGSGGNAGGANTTNEAGGATDTEEVSAFGEEPFEFSFYRHYDSAVPFGYGTDPTTQWVQEHKKLNIVEISANGNAKQKFGTMIASKELPDAIQLDRGSTEYHTMVENGLLVPLDAYYEKYPNLRELIDNETFNMLKHEDGHIYVIPNWFDSAKNPYKNSNTGWTVNLSIYKELGEPKLETLDDLYEYLKQVKGKYPNVVPVESGIVMNGVNMLFKLIYTSYGDRTIWNIGDVPMYPNMETTVFESIFDDPAYKESFKFMNKLYREGLVTQDMFTQKQEQVLEKLNTGRIAVTGLSNITGYGQRANDILKAQDPDGGYHYIPFLRANESIPQDAVNPHTFGTLGWNINVITSSAENPEKVFQFFDYWAGKEGMRMQLFGPPGILYDEVDENGAPIDNEYAKTITPEEKANLKIGQFNPMGSWYFYTIGYHKSQQDPDNVTWDTEASLYFAQFAKLNADQFNGMTLDPKTDIGIKHDQLKQLWFEYDAKLILATSDAEFDALYDSFVKEAERLGYEDILAEKTKIWQANVAMMGNS